MNSYIFWKYDILLTYNEHFIVTQLNILRSIKQKQVNK